jgi:hypothetical protein
VIVERPIIHSDPDIAIRASLVNKKISNFGEVVGNYTTLGTYTLSKLRMLNLRFNSSIPFGSQKTSKAIITINQS